MTTNDDDGGGGGGGGDDDDNGPGRAEPETVALHDGLSLQMLQEGLADGTFSQVGPARALPLYLPHGIIL